MRLKADLILFLVITLFFGLILFWQLKSLKAKEVIRSDGIGYYIYLPSIFIHNDLSLEWTIPLRQGQGFQNIEKELYGVRYLDKEETFFNKYPIGISLLWFPFFSAGYIGSLISNSPLNSGFNPIFEGFIGLAGITFGAFGLILLKNFLKG